MGEEMGYACTSCCPGHRILFLGDQEIPETSFVVNAMSVNWDYKQGIQQSKSQQTYNTPGTHYTQAQVHTNHTPYTYHGRRNSIQIHWQTHKPHTMHIPHQVHKAHTDIYTYHTSHTFLTRHILFYTHYIHTVHTAVIFPGPLTCGPIYIHITTYTMLILHKTCIIPHTYTNKHAIDITPYTYQYIPVSTPKATHTCTHPFIDIPLSYHILYIPRTLHIPT